MLEQIFVRGKKTGQFPFSFARSGGVCFALALVGVTFFAVVATQFWGYRSEFKSAGFNQKMLGLGRTVVDLANEDGGGNRCYVGNNIRLEGEIEGDVAVIARHLELAGVVQGTLFFRGRGVVIVEGGQVEVLDVRCQSVVGRSLAGALRGSWQELKD